MTEQVTGKPNASSSASFTKNHLKDSQISQQPLVFIFPVNRFVLHMIQLTRHNSPTVSPVSNEFNLLLDETAYRVPYMLAVPSAIGRLRENRTVTPVPLEALKNAVNAVLCSDRTSLDSAVRDIQNALPGSSSEPVEKIVLKWFYLCEIAKLIKTDNVLYKTLAAIPKAKYKSIKDFVSKTETLRHSLLKGLCEDEKEGSLKEETYQRIWEVICGSEFTVGFRPIAGQLIELLSKKDSPTFDHDIFEFIYNTPIQNLDGVTVHIDCNHFLQWTDILLEMLTFLHINIHLLKNKVRSAFGLEQNSNYILEDDYAKASNTLIACVINGRVCSDSVVRFLTDTLTIDKWVRTNFTTCYRDAGILTVFLLCHTAFWIMSFNGKNTKQNSAFPIFKNMGPAKQFILKTNRLCYFLIHAPRKTSSPDDYRLWAYHAFAADYFDDEDIRQFCLNKSKSCSALSKAQLYSHYQGQSGLSLTQAALVNS